MYFVPNICAKSSREIFVDFDPVAISKINEKKLVAPGSVANSLLSEQKLRAVVENARQILKVRRHA
jgi:DNA-3-methyladenine glycosylase I